MSAVSLPIAHDRRPVGLAAGAAAVVPSAEMKADPEAKLERAKHRLYVLCQLTGWGGLTALQLFYQNAADSRQNTPSTTRRS